MPYVFYDTETTGTQTAFDQILQFGAIKTDDEFVELDRFDIRCRLLPHVVPSPMALKVTQVTPAMLTDPTLPTHFDAIGQIRAKLLEWSPATFIGYNSIAFDEDLLRQAFFQNLHPAYLTNTGGNSRADIMRVSHAVHAYSPNSISVPINDKGKQTFRLDQLAPANGYNHDQAHEAMADVEATIHMARLARDRVPEIWHAMERSVTTNAVKQHVIGESMLSLTEYHFGRAYSWLVTFCGENPEYGGQLAVFDLQHDPDEYRNLSVERLVGVLNASPKVIRSLRANAQPILMPAGTAPESTKALQISPEERQRRVDVIREDVDFQTRVGQALALRFADQEPSPHVEKRIYDGFPGRQDQSLMEQFHRVDWAERVAIAEQIEDPRISEFAYRLIYFECPEVLPAAKLVELQSWVAERVLAEDENVPWTTIGKALRETDDLLEEADADDRQLLGEVKDFLCELAARSESN
jgi:exodeoxyribonuclease-1